MRLKVGSLCPGYGGVEMGLEQAFGSIDLRFVSDIDKNVNKVLAHHHPNIPNLGDLKSIDWGTQDSIDVLCAGYPCQPFSEAGQRKGDNDERAIFGYIADGIGVLRPRYLLLENVSGHLTLGGVGVIAELTRLGYDCRWGIVRASDAGAPHLRARLFIWGILKDTSGCGPSETKTAESQDSEGPSRQVRLPRPVGALTTTNQREVLADTIGLGPQKPRTEYRLEETPEPCEFSQYGAYESTIRRCARISGTPPPPIDDRGVEPAFLEWLMGIPLGYVSEVIESRSAMVRILGNGVVPQQAALALRILTHGVQWGC